LSDQPGFLDESRPDFRLRTEVRWQELQGDGTVEPGVAGEEDDPHSPAPELALQRIPPRDGRLQLEEFPGESVRRCAQKFGLD